MASDLEKGKVIAGRYRLERRLGRGGMGEVWRARHEVTERRCALKFVRTAASPSPIRSKRFFREARAASRVEHPNVIHVIDVFVDGDTPVMVMELLEGETLAERIAREGALALDEAASILAQVTSAVGAAHQRGIVHRDLKPSNVFLLPRDDAPPQVKVLDFGIAKVMSSKPGGDLTGDGQILGTPAYMAPEQCRGDSSIDHRADVWAIGIMLYETLWGRRPIAGESVGEVVERLLLDGVPPLRENAPDAPFDIAVIAKKMLEREPERRPSDLREVAAVLERHTNVDAPSFGAVSTDDGELDTDADDPPDDDVDDAPAAQATFEPSHHSVADKGSKRSNSLTLVLALAAALGAGVALLALSESGDPPADASAQSSEPAADSAPLAEPSEPPPAAAAPSASTTPTATATASVAPRPPAPRAAPFRKPRPASSSSASAAPSAAKPPWLIDKPRF